MQTQAHPSGHNDRFLPGAAETVPSKDAQIYFPNSETFIQERYIQPDAAIPKHLATPASAVVPPVIQATRALLSQAGLQVRLQVERGPLSDDDPEAELHVLMKTPTSMHVLLLNAFRQVCLGGLPVWSIARVAFSPNCVWGDPWTPPEQLVQNIMRLRVTEATPQMREAARQAALGRSSLADSNWAHTGDAYVHFDGRVTGPTQLPVRRGREPWTGMDFVTGRPPRRKDEGGSASETYYAPLFVDRGDDLLYSTPPPPLTPAERQEVHLPPVSHRSSSRASAGRSPATRKQDHMQRLLRRWFQGEDLPPIQRIRAIVLEATASQSADHNHPQRRALSTWYSMQDFSERVAMHPRASDRNRAVSQVRENDVIAVDHAPMAVNPAWLRPLTAADFHVVNDQPVRCPVGAGPGAGQPNVPRLGPVHAHLEHIPHGIDARVRVTAQLQRAFPEKHTAALLEVASACARASEPVSEEVEEPPVPLISAAAVPTALATHASIHQAFRPVLRPEQRIHHHPDRPWTQWDSWRASCPRRVFCAGVTSAPPHATPLDTLPANSTRHNHTHPQPPMTIAYEDAENAELNAPGRIGVVRWSRCDGCRTSPGVDRQECLPLCGLEVEELANHHWLSIKRVGLSANDAWTTARELFAPRFA